ncbi:MAG: outer membrane beta-barrel protein [Bacteroidota bacterium]
MQFHYLFLLLAAIGCCSLSANAQTTQRFKAGIALGFNASQIDGDDTAGYNKAGLHGGLRGVTILGEKSEFSFELLFSQRGSRAGLVSGNINDPQKILLNYIEIPVVYNFKDWRDEEGWYKFHFSGGLSYGRLLNVKIQDAFFDELSQFFNRNDIGFLLGATFYVNENFGITARFSRSLNLIFNNNKVTSINAEIFVDVKGGSQ